MEKKGAYEVSMDNTPQLYGGEFFEDDEDYMNLEDLASPNSRHAINLANESLKRDINAALERISIQTAIIPNQAIYNHEKQKCNESVLPTLSNTCQEKEFSKPIAFLNTSLVRSSNIRNEQDTGTFHQLGIMYVPSDKEDKRFNYIIGAISDNELLKDHSVKLNETAHSQIDKALSMDSEEYRGLLTVGFLKQDEKEDSTGKIGVVLINLDKMVMMKKGIKDIRLIRSRSWENEIQMYDLLPLKQNSQKQYSSTRDISYCVGAEANEEKINSDILIAAADKAPLVQKIEIINEEQFENAHPNAIARLGMTEQMKNVVARITLGHPDYPIAMKDTTSILQEIYPKIHQGINKGYL